MLHWGFFSLSKDTCTNSEYTAKNRIIKLVFLIKGFARLPEKSDLIFYIVFILVDKYREEHDNVYNFMRFCKEQK